MEVLNSLLLVWLACIATFLASKQQKILTKPLAKWVAWLIACALFAFATALMPYYFVTNIILLLSMLMAGWLMVVFTQHQPWFKPLCIYSPAALVVIGLIFTGVRYVG